MKRVPPAMVAAAVDMIDAMGSFRIDVEIGNPSGIGPRRMLRNVLVDTGAVYAANTYATDDLVFGEPGDLMLLGARSLEGLNVRIDPVAKQLVDAGPMPMAATT
jgi:hypothetical protein